MWCGGYPFFTMKKLLFSLIVLLCIFSFGNWSLAAESVVMKTVFVDDEQEKPFDAGRLAGAKLLDEMKGIDLKLILIAESFDGKEDKEKLLEGLCAVLPKEKLFGLSTYGSFARNSVADGDRVTLLGIGGNLSVQSALQTELGVADLTMDTAEEEIKTKLLQAGQTLAGKNNVTGQNRWDILLADAHSPKNGFLVRGIQEKLGKEAMILGGSANKNPGQNHVYYQGVRYDDAAMLLTLTGSVRVAMAGRFANQGETVVKTAEEAAATAVAGVKGRPLGMIAFSCAGRKSKLDELDAELNAIQKRFMDKPVFGCFCAGEVGPADPLVETTDAKCCGSGWYLMLAILFLE